MLRDLAAASSYFAELLQLAGAYGYTRPDCCPVALASDQAEEDAMVRILTPVQQQAWSFTDIDQDHVHVAVVINIAESGATPRCQGQGCQCLGDILKCSIPQVTKKLKRLTIMGPARNRIYLGINMAIGDEDVQPSVVVHIEKSSAPSHHRIGRLGQFRGPTHVRESLWSLVAV